MFYFVVKNQTVTLGTFNPRQEPYTHKAEEYTSPTGIFATGSYSAKSKIIREFVRHKILIRKYVCMCEFYLQFMDADGKVYLDMRYSFVNRKDSGGVA